MPHHHHLVIPQLFIKDDGSLWGFGANGSSGWEISPPPTALIVKLESSGVLSVAAGRPSLP